MKNIVGVIAVGIAVAICTYLVARKIDSNRGTIAEVNAIAAKLIPMMESRTKKMYAESDAPDAYRPRSRTIAAHLESTDLRHTDSLDHPVVGVIVWNQSHSIDRVTWSTIRTDAYTLVIMKKHGKWTSVSIESKCINDFSTLRNAKDDTGIVSTFSKDWCETELAAAQK